VLGLGDQMAGAAVVDDDGLVLGGALGGATDCGVHDCLLLSDPTRGSVVVRKRTEDVKLMGSSTT